MAGRAGGFGEPVAQAGVSSPPIASAPAGLLGGSARSAAARRLKPGHGGNPALERLAGLAATLLGSASSQVSLLSDVQMVVGGVGLAPGAVGGESPLGHSLCTLTAACGSPLVIADTTVDDRVCGLPPVLSGAVASYLGVPLTADDGHLVGALCVFNQTPRAWSAEDVVLLQQIAASVVAELELSALSAEYETSQVIWGLAVDAAGVGTFDWDLRTGTFTWGERLLALFGYDTTDPDTDPSNQRIEAFNARLHPDDLPRVTAALRSAIDCCGEYEAEYRVLLPDGATCWVTSRGQAIGDEAGAAVRVLGAAYDTTAMREGEARVARVLEAMPAAFCSLDRQWRFTYVNAEAERILGMPREELLGHSNWEMFPASVGTQFEVNYRHAVQTGEPVFFEAYYPAPLDSWYEVKAWPSPDGLSVYFLDVTARHAAQELASQALQRSALLAKVTAALTGTLDAEEGLGRLAQLVVPALADWCLVTLVDEEVRSGSLRGLRDVGSWHVDAAARPVVERFCELRIASLTEQSHLVRALRTEQPVMVFPNIPGAVDASLAPGEARDLATALKPAFGAVFPLRGRGRTVGMLTLFNGWQRGRFGAQDLAAAGEVAARAGLGLDNARLYTQQRQLAEGLQRALLTAPPEPDHMHVVVRYVPAAEAAQVGGDWYDAFLQPDGATMFVIGDVVGHDTAAAAAMAQVRSLLRGIAARTGDGPAEVLAGVDQVIETLQVDTTATVVVARVEQTAAERAHGITHLRWSNAGHPPPMVINPDGTVTVLAAGQPDLLLGIDPQTSRVESTMSLDRGSTVLLYTDGLVERRGQSLDEGLARLCATLAGLADCSLDELCDQVLAQLLPPQPEDDVALVAVRLHRQDRPRPAEAGPEQTPDNVPDEPDVTPLAP